VPALPFTVEAGGLRLTVRLTPRGGRDALEGIDVLADGQPVLKARVRAAPEAGAANAALTNLLARNFGVPKSAVAIVAGATGRRKVVMIEGDLDHLARVARSL